MTTLKIYPEPQTLEPIASNRTPTNDLFGRTLGCFPVDILVCNVIRVNGILYQYVVEWPYGEDCGTVILGNMIYETLTDEQCNEFRRAPTNFNDMLRACHLAGYELGKRMFK